MKLEILTPEKRLFQGEVEEITLPGAMGSFQILENHAPLIASLRKGLLSFTTEGKREEMEIEDGVAEVHNNEVIVCIESGKGIDS